MHFQKIQTLNDFKNLKAEKFHITKTEHSTFQNFVKLVKNTIVLCCFPNYKLFFIDHCNAEKKNQ